MSVRTPLLAGNWKMNKTRREAGDFLRQLETEGFTVEDGLEMAICAPFTALDALYSGLAKRGIKLGAQNVHWGASGAYTGEISTGMLTELGVSFCIVGHSERRQYFGETDELVALKLKALLAHGMTPILCVGESFETYQANRTQAHLQKQLTAATGELTAGEAKELVVAYEPLWAIGTGKTPQPKEANAVIGSIRAMMAGRFGKPSSERVRILYGGSVTLDNIAAFTDQPEIDGALVGGASLDAEIWMNMYKKLKKG